MYRPQLPERSFISLFQTSIWFFYVLVGLAPPDHGFRVVPCLMGALAAIKDDDSQIVEAADSLIELLLQVRLQAVAMSIPFPRRRL